MLEENQQTAIPIFSNLPSEFIELFSPFIKSDDLEIMDIEFNALYSNRYVSSCFTSLYPDVEIISKFLFSRMRKRWSQLSKDYKAEYNPIENYQLTETVDENVDDEVKNTGTVNTQHNDENGIFGFNSNASNPSEDGESNQTVTNDLTTKGDKTIKRTSTKTGKIGYISSQNFPDLIRADIELWNESDLIKKIYNDTADLIFIQYYGSGN